MLQPQGEARVVDQSQLIRQRLSAFLQRRPSWEQLSELGILGRQDAKKGRGVGDWGLNGAVDDAFRNRDWCYFKWCFFWIHCGILVDDDLM